MTIEEILAALQAIIDQAQTAEGQPRELTDEEAKRYEQLEVQLTAARRSAEIRARQQAYNTPVGVPGLAQPVTADKKDDGQERAFDAYLRTGQVNQDLTQLRAQGEGSGGVGGYLVPDGFRTKLIERMKAFGGIATVSEEFTTTTGAPIEWPTVDDTGNVGEIVAEAGTFAAGADITFGTNTLGAYKYMAGGGSNLPLRVSVELLQDAAFDVTAFITRALGRRIARVQATHLATGTGSGQPKGLVYGLTGTQLAANTSVTFDDLVNFIHSVDPEYRASARWVMNDTSLATLQKVKTAAGDPVWRGWGAPMEDGLQEGRLLGYPVTIDPGLDNINLSSGTVNWGAFGDINEGYVIRRVKDVQIIADPYTRAANGQVQFTAWARMDATQQNTSAYSALTGKA
jgi:HK97 family phage major capsid protein